MIKADFPGLTSPKTPLNGANQDLLVRYKNNHHIVNGLRDLSHLPTFVAKMLLISSLIVMGYSLHMYQMVHYARFMARGVIY